MAAGLWGKLLNHLCLSLLDLSFYSSSSSTCFAYHPRSFIKLLGLEAKHLSKLYIPKLPCFLSFHPNTLSLLKTLCLWLQVDLCNVMLMICWLMLRWMLAWSYFKDDNTKNIMSKFFERLLNFDTHTWNVQRNSLFSRLKVLQKFDNANANAKRCLLLKLIKLIITL